MAYARLVKTKFKAGMRDEGLRIIDKAQKEKVPGFQGILALVPVDDPNSATIISVWDSESALNASGKGIFQDILRDTENVRDGAPEIVNNKTFDMRGQIIPIRA